MREITTARASLARLGTTALAVGLACAATGAYASFASVVINAFTVTSLADPSFFVFAPTDTRNQAWFLQAESGAGPVLTNTGSVPNWSNQTRTAQIGQTRATVSSSVATDPLGLETPLFTLSANAVGLAPGQVANAIGNMFTSGAFCLWDSNSPFFDGTSASCSGAGSLEFTLFYDLLVSATPGSKGSSGYAEIDVDGTGVPNGIFFDFSSTALGVASQLDQSFTWTANLTAGNAAFFDLNGVVVAVGVPEPGVLSLAALGLLGLAATRRRKGLARTVA